MRRFLPVLSLVLFSCSAAPRPHIHVAMVESWGSRAQLLILEIPPPEHYGIVYASASQAAHIRISLLTGSPATRFNQPGPLLLHPIHERAVSDAQWLMRLQPTVHLNIRRFLAEGHVGVAPIRPTGEMLHLIMCPPDLLLAGYLAHPGDERPVRLQTVLERQPDPIYGCLFRLQPGG